MSDILMPEARVIGRPLLRPGAPAVEFVQPLGTQLQPGHRFYSESDKPYLHCADCDARVTFRKATPSSAGSSAEGRRAHFALKAGQKHAQGCEVAARPAHESALVPDRTKGFRIHINTLDYSDRFNDASGVYGRDGNGRIVIRDADLRDRERKVIRGVGDLKKLLESGDWPRINDSRVIFRNRVLDWNDFFVRADNNGQERYIGLLDRLESLKGSRRQTFCAMVLETEGYSSPSHRKKNVDGKKVLIARGKRGVSESIVPRVYVDNLNDTRVRGALTSPGTYLVLGVPKLYTADLGGEKVHYISISMTAPEQATAFDVDEILKKAKPRAERREAAAAAPAPQA